MANRTSLVTESLQARLRSDLLDNTNDSVVSELRQASEKQGRLYNLFSQWKLNRGKDGEEVWVKSQFCAFIRGRLGDIRIANGDGILTEILWRCFCYNALYPLDTTTTNPDIRALRLEDWTQAIAVLATDAASNFSRNRANFSLYGLGPNTRARKDCHWRRFLSFAKPSVTEGDPDLNAAMADLNTFNPDWRPPNTLDAVARVAATQLPLGMLYRGPPQQDIMTRVQRLVPDSSDGMMLAASSSIPYHEMLALVAAVLQIREPTEGHSRTLEPYISGPGDMPSRMAIAKSILSSGGIEQCAAFSFTDYASFAERFHIPGGYDYSFNTKVQSLWRAIFFGSAIDDSQLSATQDNPPADVLQALDFIYPLTLSPTDRQHRAQSTLTFESSHFYEDIDQKVLAALSSPHGPKIMVIRGSVDYTAWQGQHDQYLKGSPAVIVVTTSSPIWNKRADGTIRDYFVGPKHCIIQLAPHARAMVPVNERAKYAQLVTDGNFGEVTFSHEDHGGVSNLMFNFCDGTARLSTQPVVNPDGGYVEIPVGPPREDGGERFVKGVWETFITLERLEVYTVPGGVEASLAIERVHDDDSVSPMASDHA